MNDDFFKLNIWKAFKTSEARESAVKFVIKTLDIFAYPILPGETIN